MFYQLGTIANYADLAVGSTYAIEAGRAVVARNGRAVFDGLRLVPTGAEVPRSLGLRITAPGLEPSPTARFRFDNPMALRVTEAKVNDRILAKGPFRFHVGPGDSIQGSVALRYTLIVAGRPTVVLGYTPTWGEPAESHRFVRRLLPYAVNAPVAFTFALEAPAAPGRHFLIVAFGLETEAEFLFSGTNWTVGRPIWDDGNDIAGWPADSILRAMRDGRVWGARLYDASDPTGPRLVADLIAATAVEIVVVDDR